MAPVTLVFGVSLLIVSAFVVNSDGACSVTNCETCGSSTAKVCKGCYIGVPENIDYRGAVRLAVPASGLCSAYNINNCTEYEMSSGNPTSKCLACAEGFVLKADGTACLNCTAASVFENCAACASTQSGYSCSACVKGYVLKNNACQKCADNCESCSLDGSSNVVCDQCEEDYGLKPDKSECISCEYASDQGFTKYCPNCTIDDAGSFVGCLSCSSGFLTSNGHCSGCSAINDRCYRCQDDDGDDAPDACTECDEFYGIVNGNCSACSIQDTSTECYDCDGSDLDRCSQCYWHSWKRREFWVIRPDGSGCTECMDKCEICSDTNNDGTPETCSTCLNGTRYHLKDGACQDCSDNQCSQCAEETVCSACESGYTLSGDGLTCTADSGQGTESPGQGTEETSQGTGVTQGVGGTADPNNEAATLTSYTFIMTMISAFLRL